MIGWRNDCRCVISDRPHVYFFVMVSEHARMTNQRFFPGEGKNVSNTWLIRTRTHVDNFSIPGKTFQACASATRQKFPGKMSVKHVVDSNPFFRGRKIPKTGD